ncbi:MAG: hypothetical protein AUG49_26080 [Catenulispora sp. 13_1_20CM_3_70_7]|nr:MAG: hypothetical protein AUG49_26080 [Catenulispora sp. 13_1_20CM_3_70_7]
MLTLLGPVGVPGAEVDRPQQRAVLAYLLLRGGEQVSAEQLIDAVWADRAPSSARTQVHNAVSRLRRVLADSAVPVRILSRAGGYLCDAEPDAVDLTVFRTGVRQARRAAEDGRAAEAGQVLERALGLWRGDALSGINAAYAADAQALLHSERLDALELWARCQLDLGRAEQVVPSLSEAAAADPLREGLVALLMLALYRTGRQAQALELYRATQRRLSEELGVDPGSELARAHMAILQGEPAGGGAGAGRRKRSGLANGSSAAGDDAPPAAAATVPPRRRIRTVVLALTAVAICSAAVAAVTASLLGGGRATPELIPKPIHVFNVDGDCATQTQRLYICSIGLAKTPNAYRTRDDVVAHRVWHGDVLNTDCMVTNGVRVQDEHTTSTTDWYRVRLPDAPGGIAWLPAVRTHDNPVLPLCPTD